MTYTCNSGGSPGADIEWENEGNKYGVKTVAFSFYNHSQLSSNQHVLTLDELKEGFDNVLIANKVLNRNPQGIMYPYVKNLLSRNWFQVKNSDVIFAIGKLMKNRRLVDGGTGWAVQMSIDNKKETYVFDQNTNTWNKFNYETNVFDQIDYIPKLTEKFAGIGTRDISEAGKAAIKEVYKNTFST
jgi:hypothetical protein